MTDCIQKEFFRLAGIMFRFLLAGGFLVSGVVFAAPREGKLIENSPFLPENYQPPRSAQPPPREVPPAPPRGPEPLDKLEFRGLMTLGGKTSFSIFNPDDQKSYWIPLGRTDGGFTVAEYKAGEEAIVVRHEGKTRTISLHEAKVAELPAETPPPQARPRGRPQQQPQAQEPENPEERMQNLQEEIRRRRELRRAALERAQGSSQ